jgi:alkylhydroperoxidase family enzyme
MPCVRALLARPAVLDVPLRVRLYGGAAVSYVYVKSEESLWTVGFYDPGGKWQSESDHDSKEAAASRVAWLNGSVDPVATARAILDADVKSDARARLALVESGDYFNARCFGCSCDASPESLLACARRMAGVETSKSDL